MAITVAAFETKLDAVVTAIDASDWASAWRNYASASAILGGLEVEASAGGSRGKHLRRRENLDGLRTALESAEAATTRGADRRRLGSTRTAFQK